ncbi:MAG TPA: anaerobic sulfatase maturase [Patescibacteria group bacterium]|nr:anaerobic sulfatase maturase [Patescibacteria group bacterium]
MPPLYLLIKPASGLCNLRCKYCFYHDISENRETASYGIMSNGSLEAVVRKGLAYADQECTFSFQGGEPTLAGLDFFQELIRFQQKYNYKKVRISNIIQTNGYIIDDQWAEFFAKNRFLVGLSLDGIKEINDFHRVESNGKGTHSAIMRCVQLFKKLHVEFNILTVITAQSAKKIEKIYNFYKKSDLKYLQFIPCLDPLGEPRGKHAYSLSPEQYTYFLKKLFDLWYEDVRKRDFVYIRYFENLVGMVKGYAPESCGMLGHCTPQIVIEADTGVYPCDFYVFDKYRLGSLDTDSFEELEKARRESGFIQESIHIDDKCKHCRFEGLCRGGCRRDREPMVENRLSLNYYCSAYYEFFDYAIDRLHFLARSI